MSWDWNQRPGGFRRGPLGWLLPLVLGVGLGALLFGGLFGWAREGFGERDQRAFAPRAYNEHRFGSDAQQQQAQPQQQPQQQTQPQQQAQQPFAPGHGPQQFRDFRGDADQRGRPDGFGFPFVFPFFLGRVALALGLIGGGLWFLRGRRGPRGGWGGPPQSRPATWSGPAQGGPQQVAPTQPPVPSETPSDRRDPPATGETRIL